MSKKITVLNGSPRPNGNTAALINAFTKGAEGVGNKVTVFQLIVWSSTDVKDVLEAAKTLTARVFKKTI